MEESAERTEQGELISKLSNKDADQLRDQAKVFHKVANGSGAEFSSRHLPAWRKGMYLCLIFLVLLAVVFLLIAEKTRQDLVGSIGERWAYVYMDETDELLRLPPPPSRPVRYKIGSGLTAPVQSTSKESGVLFLDRQPSSPKRDEEPTARVDPVKNSANRKAYAFLVENSKVVQELASNSVSDFQFQDWQPVKNNAPEFWIDVILARALDGQGEVHMVWSVNMESGLIIPLSQEARDWEVSHPRENE